MTRTNITINTDASFVYHRRAGGYAFWIVSDYGRCVQSGVLKGQVQCSVEAEVKSIGNAFAMLDKLNWTNVNRIYVNTDCKPAMQFIQAGGKGRRDPLGLASRQTSTMIDQICRKFGINRGRVIFRHVRAHTHVRSQRNYVNDWCDKESKNIHVYDNTW
jgi:ribonuclease HI